MTRINFDVLMVFLPDREITIFFVQKLHNDLFQQYLYSETISIQP